MNPESTETAAPASPDASTSSSTSLATGYSPLRVWPALVLIGAMIAARFVPTWIEDGPAMLWMVAGFGPLLCSILLVGWWLSASRARWQERVLGLAGTIAVAVVVLALVDKSMRGPAAMMLTIPLGIASFGICLIACARMLSWERTLFALLLSVCGFGFSTLLRADGMWGDFALGLHWRWEPSAEDALLASKRNQPAGDAPALTANELDQDLFHPEWPAFRGPDRTSRQRGVKFAADWQSSPPEQLWKIAVGPAWSSFAVAGSLLFTQEQRGAMEVVACYHAPTGREVWAQPVESRFDDPLGGPGPRATPTLADGQLFAMGAQGFLLRLDPRTGAIQWKQDLREVAGRQPPMWGFSSSPLVAAGVVIVYAGGAGDKGLLGFDTESGQLRWSAPCGEHSYGSPHPCQVAGEDLVAILSNTGLDLLDPKTGADRLRYDWKSQGYRALQPQWVDADSVLIPTGMGMGTRLIRITKKGESLSTEDVWTSRNFKPDFNDFVVHQGHLYGFDGAIFCCLELATGERPWKGGRYGKGQVLLLEDSGLLLVATEQGDLVLLKADPSAQVELGQIKALEGKTWNHPVVVGDKLYLRNAQEAACFRLPVARE